LSSIHIQIGSSLLERFTALELQLKMHLHKEFRRAKAGRHSVDTRYLPKSLRVSYTLAAAGAAIC
jgi:hypothetical protein